MLPTTSTRQSDETGGEKAFKGLLDIAVDQGGSSTGRMPSNPTVVGGIKEFLMIASELKNTVGLTVTCSSGHCQLQIISQEKVRYAPSVRLNTITYLCLQYNSFRKFPDVLIGVAGNRIDISIAVCIGDIRVAKSLTLDATSEFLASDKIVRLARVFVALSSCREDLKLYYDEIEQRKSPKLSSLYPQPTPADPSDSFLPTNSFCPELVSLLRFLRASGTRPPQCILLPSTAPIKRSL